MIYILTTAKLEATGQSWVANYIFKIFYRSGKLNVEADALSRLPLENAQVDHVEPVIVKTMLESKMVTDVGIPGLDSQLNIIQKSVVVDSSPKLTHSDWVKEQSEDTDISLLIQLLKSDRLKKYVARETDSSGI